MVCMNSLAFREFGFKRRPAIFNFTIIKSAEAYQYLHSQDAGEGRIL
jgi:hypothetical protein